MNISEMLQLPIYLQVTLGSGFLAYAIAYHGRRRQEKTADLLFGTIAFGLPGLMLWLWLQSIAYAVPQTIALVVIVNVGAGLYWRKWGKRQWYRLMNYTRISNDEGTPNTWQRIIQDTTITPTQLYVTLKDGKQLCCNDLTKFRDAALPAWSIDDDGNIAMFVEDMDGLDQSQKVRDEEWGDLITYIPVEQVKSVDFRFKKI